AICKIVIATGVVTTFGKMDGVSQVNALFRFFPFANKKIGMLTRGGYYSFDPATADRKKSAIPAVITSFKIDDRQQFFNNAAAKTITIPAEANVIAIEFAALDFDRPDEQEYTYQLEG